MEQPQVCKRCEDTYNINNSTLCDMCLLQQSIRKCIINTYDEEVDELEDLIETLSRKKPWYDTDILWNFIDQLQQGRKLTRKQIQVIHSIIVKHLGRGCLFDYSWFE